MTSFARVLAPFCAFGVLVKFSNFVRRASMNETSFGGFSNDCFILLRIQSTAIYRALPSWRDNERPRSKAHRHLPSPLQVRIKVNRRIRVTLIARMRVYEPEGPTVRTLPCL